MLTSNSVTRFVGNFYILPCPLIFFTIDMILTNCSSVHHAAIVRRKVFGAAFLLQEKRNGPNSQQALSATFLLPELELYRDPARSHLHYQLEIPHWNQYGCKQNASAPFIHIPSPQQRAPRAVSCIPLGQRRHNVFSQTK